ncbi:DUF6233 domain-containing protein [Streptomyces sp. NPDC054865]
MLKKGRQLGPVPPEPKVPHPVIGNRDDVQIVIKDRPVLLPGRHHHGERPHQQLLLRVVQQPPQSYTPRERVPGAQRTHLTPRHTTTDPPRGNAHLHLMQGRAVRDLSTCPTPPPRHDWICCASLGGAGPGLGAPPGLDSHRGTHDHPPAWLIEHGIGTGRPAVRVHTGDCWDTRSRCKPATTDAARRASPRESPPARTAVPTPHSASSTDDRGLP